MKRYRRLAPVLFILTLLTLGAAAQQPATTATKSSPPSAQSEQKQPSSQQELQREEKQRALGVIPMFAVSNVKDAKPLTVHQKFQLMMKTMVDPFTFLSAGFTAGIGQADDSFPQYGQGAEGFGKRYGAAFADGASSNFFSNFVYPSLFKEDPRYFRLGKGRFQQRAWHAFTEEFIAHKDSGGREFHYSNVLGAITAGSISNAYYPSNDRGAGLTFSRAGISLGYSTAGNLFLEYWPDVARKVFHTHNNQAHPSPSSATPAK